MIAVARRAERLRELEAEIADRRLPRLRAVPADLSTTEGLEVCRQAVADRGADVAVLNAGFGSLGPLAAAERAVQADMVRLNCVATVDLTCHLLPEMVRRRRGALIVLSSAAADQPIPFMATYAASKVFGLYLAEALAEELRGTGVRAIAVCPGPVHTEFGAVAGARDFASGIPHPSAEDVVERTWAGLRRGARRVGVGPVAALTAAARPLPRSLPLAIAGYLHRRRAGS